MKSSSLALLVVCLVAVAALATPSTAAPPAIASPAVGPAAAPFHSALPPGVYRGAKLWGVQLARPLGSVLAGYTGPSWLDVVEVDGSWIAVDYQGSLEKETWINFDHVLAYRTER